MKRIIFTCLICFLLNSICSSQNIGENFICGQSIKRIENNLMGSSIFNIKSKSDIEKLFFGDLNALIEFCYMPSSEVNPCMPSGFRIIRDSCNSSYILEVKRVINCMEAIKEASIEAKKAQMSQLLDFPAKFLDSLPRDVLNQIWEYNRKISDKSVFHKMYSEELPKHYKVEIKSIRINNHFAEKLYKMMISFIDNYKAIGIPPMINDGYSVSFSTVVADEVWSLRIHMPIGDANKMANLCLKIINDVNDDDQIEESTFKSVLDNY
jgi:hypothetical protein